MRERLIIFTRYPEPGKTKTRLIPVLGPHGASELHRRMTLRVLNLVKRIGRERSVSLEVRHEGGTKHLMELWLGPDTFCSPQGEGDLGRRMARAFSEAFQTGLESVVLVGTDCPGLTLSIMQIAFDALMRSDVVLGPARDGGYYLIGLRRGIPELFADVSWGTQEVLDQTVRIAGKLGLSVALVDTLDDVDRPEDLPVWEKAAGTWISIIIPALNEAANIAGTLESIRGCADAEVIVVDGGSKDETAAVAESYGARVIISPPGRAVQMNAGAAAAAGGVLMFLHADTRLPEGFDRWVHRVLARPRAAAGAFELHVADSRPRMRIIERIANIRSRRFQMPYGDQAVFLRAEMFREIGGFPGIPIMEDVALIRRLRRRGRIMIAPVPATTSARRWKNLGLMKTTLINQALLAAYFLGVSPWRIARWYNRDRGLS